MILNSNECKIYKDAEKMKNNNYNRINTCKTDEIYKKRLNARPDITSRNQKLEKDNWRNNIPHSAKNQIRNVKYEQNIL